MDRRQRYKLIIQSIMLGFTSFIVQLVMLRDFINLFLGNELVIGVILALWMLITMLGAYFGKHVSKNKRFSNPVPVLLLFMAIFPAFGILFTTWLKAVLFVPGVMIGLHWVVLISSLGLSAFCIVSGMTFTILASVPPPKQGFAVSKIYMLEAVGSLSGGILFNFILIHLLDSMHILFIVFIINALVIAYLLMQESRLFSGLAVISLTAIISVAFFSFDPDQLNANLRYPDQEVILSQDTPYGKLVVTRQSNQLNFYQNGNPVPGLDDIITREEKVHYGMSLHPHPKRVLMLGGGLDRAGEEVLKYNIDTFDLVDPDQWTIEAARELTPYQLPDGITVHYTDLRRYLERCERSYDVILLNTDMPTTIGHNRFFTDEFFRQAKHHLNEHGIMSLKLPSSGNYLDEPLQELFSSIYNSLEKHFKYIRIVPGAMTYYLASDDVLNASIPAMIEKKGIATEYVNQYYLDEDEIRRRAQQIEANLQADTRINTDFHPIVTYIISLRWLRMMKLPLWLTAVFPLLIMLVLVIFIKPLNLGLFTTGFTASAAEFLLMIAFQLAYGFIYQMAGIIIMIFMAGLAFGSGYLYRFIPESKAVFIRIQKVMGLLIGFMPLIIILASKPGIYWLSGLFIFLMTFITGGVTGLQYRLATRIQSGSKRSIAASTYGADLAGSAFGLFFIAVFVFPLAGLWHTAILLAMLNFAIAARMQFQRPAM